MPSELIITALLELFVLILLILAVSKLYAIHKVLQPKTTAFDDYNKHDFFNDDEKALEALKDAYWHDIHHCNPWDTDAVNKKYDALFIKYGIALSTLLKPHNIHS